MGLAMVWDIVMLMGHLMDGPMGCSMYTPGGRLSVLAPWHVLLVGRAHGTPLTIPHAMGNAMTP